MLLEREGAVEEAATLFIQARYIKELSRLIQAHAQTFLDQGRVQTVESWCRTCPEKEKNAKPWLWYWLANCRFGVDLGEA